jgi:hypothetical protein
VRFESALALGDVWALDQLWRELGFDRLAAVFRRARYTTPVEHAMRVMVFNRLCDPSPSSACCAGCRPSACPMSTRPSITHQQLLRSMDALMDHQASVDDCVAQLLRPLIDDELSVVFYDLTTIRTEGLSEQAGDVRRFGMSKEGVIARQFMLGVVQTADGCRSTTRCSTATPARRPRSSRRSSGCCSATRTSAAWWWWPTGGCCRWTTSRCSAS